MARLLLLSLGCAAAVCGHAQDASVRPDRAGEKTPKYPLRLHILAVDDTHRTVRMQPNWCSGSMPDMSGGEGGPCTNNATLAAARMTSPEPDEPTW